MSQLSEVSTLELHMAMTKFEGNLGYSLLQCLEADHPSICTSPGRVKVKNKLPIFVRISKLEDIYECFAQANYRNRVITKKQ